MDTIDWPLALSQTYINIIRDGEFAAGDKPPEWVIAVDDDHQTFGKHSDHLTADQARQLAAAHRRAADALSSAADVLERKVSGESAGEESGNGVSTAPRLAQPRQA
jgi:hypothetical protein